MIFFYLFPKVLASFRESFPEMEFAFDEGDTAVGSVKVPTPVLSTPSVIAVNYGADETFKSFVSAWAEYNRRIGNNQTWILNSLKPFGVELTDMPPGFGFGG